MSFLRLSLFPILLATLAIAADSPGVTTERIRQANRAFERGEFDLADRLYAEAALATDDPGLVAFNLGVLQFQRGQFREAELNFRRALDDSQISESRRVRGWYNLGNSLLKQAGNDNVGQLRSAISCYENALDRLPMDDPLREDAIYNLELAKLLWARANAERPQPNTPNEVPPEEPPTPKKEQKEPGKKEEGKNDGKEPANGKEKQPKTIESKGNATPKESDEKKKSPGAGRLPVLIDDSVVQPLPPEDTRASLQRIEERLRKERLNLRKEAAGAVRDRDW